MSSLVGQTIGKYRVEALLGKGRMSEVYRARNTELSRPVVIKVMHAHLATDERFRGRFVREVKAAAALKHPNIVDIYDFSRQEHDGLLYMVMEYVPHGSIRTLLQQQSGGGPPLSVPLALDMVRQAADGLAFAHGKGIVHRAIKPDNLLLADPGIQEEAGRAYTVKISDFGLASLAEGGIVSAAGAMMGSPAYMSPEQCEGAQLDGRSDLYSLGIVLYEVATGYLPFEIQTVSDAVYKHVSVPPVPPLQVRPDLPDGLDAIILQCLAKRPVDRFATGSALSAALSGLIAKIGADAARPVVSPTAVPPSITAHGANRSSLPRLHVLDRNGQQQNTLAITPRGVTVGRGTDNVVVLPEGLVSRNHVRIDWDGQRVTVTDLGAANGSFLGDHRLAPQAPTDWAEGAWLRVGSYWLSHQPPTSGQQPVAPAAPASAIGRSVAASVGAVPVVEPLPVVIPAAPPSQAAYASPPAHRERIHVTVEDGETLSITPGQPAVVRVRLANLGPTVDHFRVTIEGMPVGWVHGPEQEIQLNPNDAVPIALTIATARSPEYVAGEYPVTIRARSRENPADSGEAHAFWTLLPYTASSLTIDPALVTSRIRADYHLAVQNNGNAAGRYALAGKDDERTLGYRFQPEILDLDPGMAATVGVTVLARRKWLGRAQARPFNIEAVSTSGEPPQPVRGEWVQRAILPAWTPLIPIALFGALVLIYFLLQPSIQIFIDPASPVAGQPVTVRWNVSHANRIDLAVDGIDVAKDLDPNTKGKVFERGLGGKAVAAVAKNRLGKSKTTLPLTVAQPTPLPTPVPETPVVDLFEVDRPVVLPNEKVIVRWKVHNAESVAITSNTGINETNLKIEDTKQFPITMDTTFTIVAMNRGKETKQSTFAGTSAAVATSVSQTAVVSTVAAGTAAVVTAAAQTTVAGSTAAVQTTTAGSTAAAQTSSAGQNQGAQTAAAVANVATQTAVAGSNIATQTTAANSSVSTQTAIASGNLATQTSTANGTATAMVRAQGTQAAQATQTAVAPGTATAQAQGTTATQARTQTAQAQLTATAQAKTTITVTEKDFAITLNSSTIQAGMVTFKVVNEGPSLHHFKLLQGTTERKLMSVDAGKTETTDPVDLKPGTYTIVCDIPGHEALGMKVTLTVI